MADNLIIKIDGDASHLEKELNNAAGSGVRAFRQLGDRASKALEETEDKADDLRRKLVDTGEDGEDAMDDLGRAGDRALDPLLSDADKARRGVSQLGSDGVKDMGRLEAAANKAAMAFKAIAGAAIVRAVVNFGKEAIGLASDLVEVQNVLDVTFGEGNERIEAFAKNASRQYGMSELAARQFTGTMGAMLKSMDVSNVEDMSMDLVALAGDMASFYNLSVDEAFSKIRSGISGSTEPLKQLGINMSVANLEAFALAQGIKKSYDEMSSAEQATLRYQYLMHVTADAQGDFVRTSDSMSNQLKVMQLNIENIKASIGKALLPAATAAVTAFNHFINNMVTGFPAVKAAVSDAVSNIRQEMDRLGITSRLQGLLGTVKRILNQIIGHIISVISTFAKSPVFQEVEKAFSGIFQSFLSIWDSLGDIISALWDYLEPVWEGIKASVSGLADTFWSLYATVGNVLSNLFSFVSGIFDLIAGVLTLDKDRIVNAVKGMKDSIINIAKALWTGIGNVLNGLWTTIKDFLTKTIQKIKEKVAELDLKAKGKELIESLKAGIKEKWEEVKAWFLSTRENALAEVSKIDLKQKAIDIISSLLAGFIEKFVEVSLWLAEKKQELTDWIGTLNLKEKAIAALQTLKDGFFEKWAEISTWFSEKKQEILNTLSSIDLAEIGKNIVNSLKQGFLDAWSGFVGTIEDLINSTLDKIPDGVFQLLNMERTHVSLRGESSESGSGEDALIPAGRGTRKSLGVYPTGTMDPETALELYNAQQQAEDAVVEAAETVENTVAETLDSVMDSVDDSLSSLNSVNQSVSSSNALDEILPDTDPDLPQTEELTSQIEAASQSIEEAAEIIGNAVGVAKTTAETAETAAAAVQAAAESIEEGVEFEFSESSIDDLADLVSDVDLGSDEEPDYIQQGIDWLTSLFQEKTDQLDADLNGIDSSINRGVDRLAGGTGAGSQYSLLDEYNELMGLWSTNLDENGEWLADWSEGGIGQTLANLIQDKMPGKYWADLTEEDLQRMAGMTASAGYAQGQYQTQFRPEITEPVDVPANLEVLSIEGSEGEVDALDLAALSEAIPEETIVSWQNLGDALQGVMDILGGGETGTGLAEIFSTICTLVGSSIPSGIETLAGALTETLPTAVEASLQSLGIVTFDEEGNSKGGGGNTLYTSLGSIYGLFQDTNTEIEYFCKGLSGAVPAAVEAFKIPAGEAIGLMESLWIAAANAAGSFQTLADAIGAVADAIANLQNGGSGGDGSGSEFSGFAAAHGGQVSGVGIVGENGPEIVSFSRNMNVFTNRALEIAQAKVANQLARGSWTAGINNQTANNIDNSRTTSVNVGTVLGSDWLGAEMNRRIRRIVEKEMFYAG